MTDEQLEKLRNLFLQAEAERERLRSKSLVWRLRRATVTLLAAHSQSWHHASGTASARRENRGERIRALCALLAKSEHPKVMEALPAQLRQAIDEFVRSASQPRVFDRAVDRQSSVQRAA